MTHDVLVVEHDGVTRTDLAGRLRDGGHSVLEAVNGDEAVALVAAMGVRVVVVDVALPEPLTGIELTRRLQRDHPDVEVLLTRTAGRIAPLVVGATPMSRALAPGEIKHRVEALLNRAAR
jgi:CheY-like chemotaxis protein